MLKFFRALAAPFRRLVSVPLFACLVSAWLVIFCNAAFWRRVAQTIPFGLDSLAFYAALALIMLCVYALALTLATLWRLGKPFALLAVALAGGASWFMDAFGVRIDKAMLKSVLLTDAREASDFFTISLLAHSVFFILFPVLAVVALKIKRLPLKREITRCTLFGAACLVVGCLCFGLQYKAIASFFRAHGDARYLLNPVSPVSAGISLAKGLWEEKDVVAQPIGTDARLKSRSGKPRLVALVIGETARAANWGLSGYERQTTPVLAGLDAVNFPLVTACGTSTAVSLPCMFSPFPRSAYTDRKGKAFENLVDVLDRAGVEIIWRDNDSGGSKGVAARIGEESLAEAAVEGLCGSGGCHDAILLSDLEEKLAAAPPGRDILLVLHQKGSHGPAYYQRYPEAFSRYTPACRSADLQKCSRQEIVNAYDNTIAYTDYFLGQVAERLAARSDAYDVALLYVSDHGESLGEYGVYLHGVPWLIAPREQIHVPMLVWLPEISAGGFGVDMARLRETAGLPASHDNLFHSVLGLMGVETGLYEKNMDIFAR